MLAVVILPILIPLNIIHGRNASDSIHGLDRLSWANVGATHVHYYWAHFVSMAYAVAVTCFLIYREMNFYIKARQSYLLSHVRDDKCSARTILVSDIPTDKISIFSLTRIYGGIAGDVQTVVINRDYTQLMQDIKKRDTLHLALEIAETRMIQKALKSIEKTGKPTLNTSFSVQSLCPQHRPRSRLPILPWLPSLPLIGVEVDLIDHNRKEIFKLNHQITELQAKYEKYPPLNSAFISFSNARSANLAYQSLIDSKPATFQAQSIGVEPRDIIWPNLSHGWLQRTIRPLMIRLCVALLIAIWALPIAFTGFLSQISYVIVIWPKLHFLEEVSQSTLSLLQGIAPQVLLLLLTMMLPLILRFLSEQQGLLTYNAVEIAVQNYYFTFLFIQVFLTVSLSSSITTIADEIYHGFNSVPKVLAKSLPKTSNYFLSYILLQAFSISAGQLIQIPNLVKCYVLTRALDITPRAKAQRKRSMHTQTQWGTLYPVFTNLACIGRVFDTTILCIKSDKSDKASGLIYSTIAPLILPICMISFLLLLLAFRYNLLFVIQPQSDVGGFSFPSAWNHVFVGLYTLQLCAIGLFILVRDEFGSMRCIGQVVITIVTGVMTAFFQVTLGRITGPNSQYMPLGDAEYAGNLAPCEPGSGHWPVHNDSEMLEPKEPANDVLNSLNNEVHAQPNYQHFALWAEPPVIWIPKDSYGISDEELRATKAVDATLAATNQLAWFGKNGEVVVAHEACIAEL